MKYVKECRRSVLGRMRKIQRDGEANKNQVTDGFNAQFTYQDKYATGSLAPSCYRHRHAATWTLFGTQTMKQSGSGLKPRKMGDGAQISVAEL